MAEKERDRLKCIVKDLRASLSTKHKLIEELEAQKENEKTELEVGCAGKGWQFTWLNFAYLTESDVHDSQIWNVHILQLNFGKEH